MDLKHLNQSQKDAVVSTEGPVMILAGAGSGKTRTLVSRIIYLLSEKKIFPHQILAMTFSNKAAKEMRERVIHSLGEDMSGLKITTFHSFCAYVMRSEAHLLGLSRNFTIFDTSESLSIVKTLIKRRGLTTKDQPPYDILNYVDTLNNLGFWPGREKDPSYEVEFEIDEDFYSYYLDYQTELKKSNALDFGGLITGTIQLLKEYPDVLDRYNNRFHYILIDEYQDTNRSQFELMNLLSQKRGNICVVGDEDQSIYSWRGADIRNILDFESTYPNVKLIKLEQNYRSSRTIIDAASAVIEKNTERKGKRMFTNNNPGDAIEITESADEHIETANIVKEIKRLHSEESVELKDIAIFYRNNSQSRVVEEALRKERFNYRIIGGIKFYERKEVKDVLAYVRVVTNPRDSLALSRIINVPARGIGATSLRKLENEAINSDLSLWEVIDLISASPDKYSHLKMSKKVMSSLSQFSDLINEVRSSNENKILVSKLVEKLIHESGYYQSLKISNNYETLARMENLEELINGVASYEQNIEKPSLEGFLETITLDNSVNDGSVNHETDEIGISLMTVHGSKGLEFPYVFVTAVEDSIFPSSMALDDEARGEEEERRLFYVAITRAMKKLYISYAASRMMYGQVKFNGASRYLYEIPEDYVTWKRVKTQKRKAPWQKEYDEFSQVNNYEDDLPVSYVNAPVASKVSESFQKFSKGAALRHKLYGEGCVISSDGTGVNEKVTIKFGDGAIKKFMVKFAPLELIN